MPKLQLDSFSFACGRSIPLDIVYTLNGALNPEKTNAVLICHAWTGSAAVLDWWKEHTGAGKAFDTEKFCLICVNVVGGCSGTTGPASLNPKTGKPYGPDFPQTCLADMVQAQKLVLEHLGIKRCYALAGGSMGGMQVLQWLGSAPEISGRFIIIASALKHSARQVALNEASRMALKADAFWKGGHYYESGAPKKGLAAARALGHITFMSESSMGRKFGRSRHEEGHFEVENYLRYRGENFHKRFDANSYLLLSQAMDAFEASFKKPLGGKALVLSFSSDWLYPPQQSEEITESLRKNGVDACHYEINHEYGHDAFLIPNPEQEQYIKDFLK